MKIKDLITKLQDYSGEAEIVACDGKLFVSEMLSDCDKRAIKDSVAPFCDPHLIKKVSKWDYFKNAYKHVDGMCYLEIAVKNKEHDAEFLMKTLPFDELLSFQKLEKGKWYSADELHLFDDGEFHEIAK